MLLAEVDAALPRSAEQIEIVVVGGAALALRWNLRSTVDIDVISEHVPAALRNAAAIVAEEHGLAADWLNDAAKGFTPAMDALPSLVFSGDRLAVYAASDRFLLAMKLFAARETDLVDCAFLADATGIDTAADLVTLVEAAYRPRPLPPKVQYFADAVAQRRAGLPSLGRRPPPDPSGRTPQEP